jgi:hypothetical protein
MPAAMTIVSASYKPMSLTDDADIRDAVQKALAAANAQIGIGGAYGGTPYVKEGNSGAIWRGLYDSLKGKEIPELRRIISLRRGQNDSLIHWKAIAFLKYSLRMEEGKAQAEPVFAQLLTYDIYDPWDPLIRTTVDDALLAMPVPPERKNEMILAYVKSGDPRRASDFLGILASPTSESAREVTRLALVTLLANRPDLHISAFPNAFEKVTARDKQVETGAVLLQRLEQSPGELDGATLLLFKKWHFTNAIPNLRRLCSMANNSAVINVTRLLSDWKDKASQPEIRGVVEMFRYGNNGFVLDSVLSDLATVADGDTDAYIADVLQTASPAAQQVLLAGCIKRITSKPVQQAVEALHKNSIDPGVRKAAAEYLGIEVGK